MSKVIGISYSWGDEEPDVKIPENRDPWEFMLSISLKEISIECHEHCNDGDILITPEENKITITYTDDQKCYYEIKEETEDAENE